MWLAFYNASVGDVLLLTRGQAPFEHIQTKTENDITAIYDEENDRLIGLNFFNVKDDLQLEGQGHIQLNEEQIARLNQKLQEADIKEVLTLDQSPKLVVGYVESCQKHEDSDHLSITQTNVGTETLQIVCGAANIGADMSVIVAKPGAVMPDGLIIRPGELRGVQSNGMICSTRELGLEELGNTAGIWILTESFEPGTPLEEVVQRLSKL